MRLTAICNGSKWTISVSDGTGLLQMVSESDTKQCAKEDAEPPRGVDCETPPRLERRTNHFLGWRENEACFIRVWEPLPNRRILKP